MRFELQFFEEEEGGRGRKKEEKKIENRAEEGRETFQPYFSLKIPGEFRKCVVINSRHFSKKLLTTEPFSRDGFNSV